MPFMPKAVDLYSFFRPMWSWLSESHFLLSNSLRPEKLSTWVVSISADGYDPTINALRSLGSIKSRSRYPSPPSYSVRMHQVLDGCGNTGSCINGVAVFFRKGFLHTIS